jgi:WD40 repeat protein
MRYKLHTMLIVFTFPLAGFIAQCIPSTGAMGQERVSLKMHDVLDLERDGVNAVTFSPVSRELFVSNTTDNRNLHQWNITAKKLVHTYLCPGGDAHWSDVAVSPDGKLLVAANYPHGDPFRKSTVQFIDTQTHKVRFEAQYDYLIREIAFDRAGRLVWLTTTDHGPDDFVYDWNGKKIKAFNSEDFEPPTRKTLWDVPASKGGPPEGLFFRDDKGTVHRLISNPLNQNYARSSDAAFIGTSTWDKRVRIWRTSDLQEVFNEEAGAHPVHLLYDSKANAFLILDGMDGNTQLRSITLPRQNIKTEQERLRH